MKKVINYTDYFVILVIKLDVKSWKTMCRLTLSMHGLIHLHPDTVYLAVNDRCGH